MKVVAAYLLAGLGGNAAPSEADIKKILSSGARRRRGCGASCSMRGCGGRAACSGGGRGAEGSMQEARPGSAGLQGGACSAGGRLLTAGPLLPCLPAAVGIEADSERVSKLLSELEGKDIAEVRSRRRPRGRCCLLPPAACFRCCREAERLAAAQSPGSGLSYAQQQAGISESENACCHLPAASSARA
jgi:ribosomal protein L12E/L44/L45/RPP1/RPP2